tara:strand:- start:290 stop:469 length:180 start_codon:yes stop_codon:yes gene_type:complete
MTEEEKEYLEAQIPVLRNQMADCTNRITILKHKRADIHTQLKGIRARLERDKMEEVSDW